LIYVNIRFVRDKQKNPRSIETSGVLEFCLRVFEITWRSSNNYKGWKIFSILAKVMLVVWSLNFIAGLYILGMTI